MVGYDKVPEARVGLVATSGEAGPRTVNRPLQPHIGDEVVVGKARLAPMMQQGVAACVLGKD